MCQELGVGQFDYREKKAQKGFLGGGLMELLLTLVIT